MIIAVDIGNSAIKAALVEGQRVRETGRLDIGAATLADLVDGLRVLAAGVDEPPESILAVSVVDRWTERLEQAAGEVGLRLTVVAASHVPISTLLLRPDQAGPDRLLAGWAGAALHGLPVIVVDLGTATTVDAVDADGFFLGGAILPGLRLAADALAEGTARLPRVELRLPQDVIGDETTSALQSGLVIGHVGAVREIVVRMRSRLEGAAPRREGRTRPTPVVVTGGHASADWAARAWLEKAGPELPAVASVIEPALLLQGLGLLAEHMAGRPRAGTAG